MAQLKESTDMKLPLLLGFWLLVGIVLSAVLLYEHTSARDDAFRHHCVDQKRVYDAGNCLGSASEAARAKQKQKPPRERTWTDLAASCHSIGGWLASSAGEHEPKCEGVGRDISPPVSPP